MIGNFLKKDAPAQHIKGYIQRHGIAGTTADKIEFDAIISETHSHVAKVTTHPVETGIAVSDFTRPEPIGLKIEGVITNHPIELPGSQVDGIREVKKTFTYKGDIKLLGKTMNGAGVIGTGVKVIGGAIGLDKKKGWAKGYSSEFYRVEECYEILAKIVESGEAVTVFTTLSQYDDMVLESFSSVRDADKGNSLFFTIEAKQLRIVDTKTTTDSLTNNIQAKSTKNKARQAPVEASADLEEPAGSILSSAGGAMGLM